MSCTNAMEFVSQKIRVKRLHYHREAHHRRQRVRGAAVWGCTRCLALLLLLAPIPGFCQAPAGQPLCQEDRAVYPAEIGPAGQPVEAIQHFEIRRCTSGAAQSSHSVSPKRRYLP